MSIAIQRIKRAIQDMPTGGMQTGKKQIKLEYSDAQRAITEIEALKAERDEIAAQLVAVKEGSGTGQSPCAKFCESIALGKDFDQLREHADKMKVERDALAEKLATLEADVLQREAQLILTAHHDPSSKMSQQTIGTLQKIGGIMMTRSALARAKGGVA